MILNCNMRKINSILYYDWNSDWNWKRSKAGYAKNPFYHHPLTAFCGIIMRNQQRENMRTFLRILQSIKRVLRSNHITSSSLSWPSSQSSRCDASDLWNATQNRVNKLCFHWNSRILTFWHRHGWSCQVRTQTPHGCLRARTLVLSHGVEGSVPLLKANQF